MSSVRYEDLMSSDSSDDDTYNYLTALDNLNWIHIKRGAPNRGNGSNLAVRPLAKPLSKPLARPAARPAVAIKTKTNRNEGLFKAIIASEKEKLPAKEVKETQKNEKNKRDLESDEELDVLVNDVVKTTINNNNNDNYSTPLNPKRQKTHSIRETEFSVSEILKKKKEIHEKSVSNNNNNIKTKTNVNVPNDPRLFGKAFSPTVYSPEVPVMRPPVQTQAVGRRSMTLNDESSLPDSHYNPNPILAVILDWNANWLNECSQNEVPPPLSPFGEGIGVKTCYESLDEYQSAYVPLILFETWAQIYDEFHKKRSEQDNPRISATVSPDYSSDEHFITLTFQTTVNRKKFRKQLFPNEGHLILMELYIDVLQNNDTRKVVLFGYVSEYSCESMTNKTSFLPGIVVPQSNYSNTLLLKYSVHISKKSIRINNNNPITFYSVYYLKPTMRQIELIAGLNMCPLFKDILKPRIFTCQVVVPNKVCLNTPCFNESQSRAILGSYEALNRPYAVPKLLFVQGPPGTGKTHTLIGIIKHIYLNCHSERMPRILICAPSNGGVDEIARRIYSERRFLQKHKSEVHRRQLRCVRIGQPSQIHPDVRKISLDVLIEDNIGKEEKRHKEQKDKQTRDIEERIAEIDQQLANSPPDVQKTLNEEMKRLMNELQAISFVPKSSDTNKTRLKIDIMDKADIVLSTLNSCQQQPIENLYRNYGPKTFDCVIIDEASQCSEPELLMPLAYKMTKMILIGDPMQLPATIISKKASKLQLGRSLFERFFHYYRQIERDDPKQKSPILMLTEQYRMHPMICQFPSQHFYDGKLLTNERVLQKREFNIRPYIVFDVTDTQESRNDPTNKFNELEANFVIRLIEIIDQMMADNPHKHNLGVITPYNGQKKYLNQKLEKKKLKTNVEINTVDGFQGQERDIIILSCVRAFENGNQNSIGFLNSVQRMNVALTRAKYSMIVCVSGRSLESDDNWKALIDDAMKRSPHSKFKVPSTLAKDKLKKMLEKVDKIEVIDCN